MFAPNRNFSKSAAYHIFVKSPGYDSVKYNRDILVTAILGLAESSGGKISFTDGTVLQGKNYTAEKHSADKITVREFTGNIKERWKTHSYSAIASRFASHASSEEKDFQSEYHVKQERGKVYSVLLQAQGPVYVFMKFLRKQILPER